MKTTAYFQATIKFVNYVHVCYVLQMYICLISIHALYMTIHHFIVCVQADWKGSNNAHLHVTYETPYTSNVCHVQLKTS